MQWDYTFVPYQPSFLLMLSTLQRDQLWKSNGSHGCVGMICFCEVRNLMVLSVKWLIGHTQLALL